MTRPPFLDGAPAGGPAGGIRVFDPVREQLLEATAMLVQETGIERLTLEAVADAAEVTLGEVEARFPTVSALVVAAGQAGAAAFVARVAEAAGADETPGAYLRGYIEASFPTGREQDNLVALVACLLRSAPLDSAVFEPLRVPQREIDAAITTDGIDPVLARIVRFASDGLYMNDVFGLTTLTAAERAEMLARLKAMATIAED